jgi:hypothetical protein
MCMRVFTIDSVCACEDEPKSGVDLIAEARDEHQLKYGDHFDDDRVSGALPQHAAALAYDAGRLGSMETYDRGQHPSKRFSGFWDFAERFGGWHVDTADARPQLAKAGAFCAAEIDRLNRLERAETARKKAAEAARNKPRRFQFEGGAGVYTPADETYRYVRTSDGACDTYCGLFLQWVFNDLRWIDAAPLN